MEPGSLVVIKKELLDNIDDRIFPFIKWLPINDEKTIYTIRGINEVKNQGVFCSLEENIIGYFENSELVINILFLIEIQKPLVIDINELIYSDQEVLI